MSCVNPVAPPRTTTWAEIEESGVSDVRVSVMRFLRVPNDFATGGALRSFMEGLVTRPWGRTGLLLPRPHLVGQRPSKTQLEIDPGTALRLGLEGDAIGGGRQLGYEGVRVVPG